MSIAIKGIDDYTPEMLAQAVMRGGKFLQFDYAFSVGIMSFRRSSDIFYVPEGSSALKAGALYTTISMLFGWWGFPFGIIFTIQSLATNFGGGRDLTREVWDELGLGYALQPQPDQPYGLTGPAQPEGNAQAQHEAAPWERPEAARAQPATDAPQPVAGQPAQVAARRPVRPVRMPARRQP